MSVDWRELAGKLADSLLPESHLDPEWRTAFARTPRHRFVTTFYDTTSGTWVSHTGEEERLHLIYANTNLITQMRHSAAGGQGAQRATSSSSMPAIMAWMLQETRLTAGSKVLEIGTGTGYNTAILCDRIGAENVTSIDLDPSLVDAARTTLALLGHHPTLLAGDGTGGCADNGPYDAVISTAAADHVPPAWIEQLVLGGRIVTDLRGSFAGAMTTLQKTDENAVTGRCHSVDAAFMPLREDLRFPLRHGAAPPLVMDRRNPATSTTAIDLELVERDPSLRFAIELQLGAVRADLFGTTDELVITADDDSWASVIRTASQQGRHIVLQNGPRRVWDSVVAATEMWEHAGRPTLADYSVTAGDDLQEQRIRLGASSSMVSWPLPI